VRKFLSFLFLVSLTSFNFAQSAKPPQTSAKTTAAAAAQPARQAYEVPFVNKTLANGLEVIVLPDSGVPLVTVELAVRNGSFTEPPELNGLSHLYEHMFFKTNQAVVTYQCETLGSTSPRCGNVSRLRPQIGDVRYIASLGNLGITYNGTTQEEVVDYYYTTTSPYLETAIKAMNDSVRYPLFDETEFANEKRVVVGEIDRQESNPFFALTRTMSDKLFYKYPTRKNPLGTRESVLTATTEKMRLIQSRYYVPNNTALVVTGDVKPEEVFKLAEQIMGSWEKRPVDPFKEFPLVEHPPLPKSEGIIIEKNTGADAGPESDGQNVIILIGWQGPSIGKDDKTTYAADVFSYIISQPDSKFQRDLVDSGLATGVAFGYYTQRNVGPINLNLITTPDKAKAAIKAVYAEIAQFNQPGYFTDEELESSKTTLEANDLFQREKLSEYAHTLSFWWSSTGIDYFRGYQRNLRATSRQDINNYVTTYIQGKPHVAIALLAPEVKTKANLTEQDLIGGK
jgi:zinc protease